MYRFYTVQEQVVLQLYFIQQVVEVVTMCSLSEDVLLLVRKCSVKLNGLPIKSVFCPIATAKRVSNSCYVSVFHNRRFFHLLQLT